jgi:hypothetical protein
VGLPFSTLGSVEFSERPRTVLSFKQKNFLKTPAVATVADQAAVTAAACTLGGWHSALVQYAGPGELLQDLTAVLPSMYCSHQKPQLLPPGVTGTNDMQ